MLWVMILAVVGMVFAPAMWLRPSHRERRVGGLREAVIDAGVSVRLEKSPIHADKEQRAAYRWSYPSQRPGPTFVLVREAYASQALKSFEPGWRWRVEPLRPMPRLVAVHLAALLARLPEDACVIESGRGALTLWWEESLERDAFMPLVAPFGELRDALADRPDRERSARPMPPPG